MLGVSFWVLENRFLLRALESPSAVALALLVTFILEEASAAAGAAAALPGFSRFCESISTCALSSSFSSRSLRTSSTTSAKLNSAFGASAERREAMLGKPA